jgi:dihydrofolate reductase
MIKLIIAIDRGNAIGWSDGALAYNGLKQDMRRFKELTTGHTVVMGFNTWKSLKRPTGLPNRKNVVLTRKPYSEAREFFSASSDIDIISSLDYVKQMAARRNADQPDIWIIGGKSVYEEALRLGIVDEVFITLIHASCEADVVMDTDLASWKLFVIRNPQWLPTLGTTQWDGDFQTTYLHLAKQ